MKALLAAAVAAPLALTGAFQGLKAAQVFDCGGAGLDDLITITEIEVGPDYTVPAGKQFVVMHYGSRKPKNNDCELAAPPNNTLATIQYGNGRTRFDVDFGMIVIDELTGIDIADGDGVTQDGIVVGVLVDK